MPTLSGILVALLGGLPRSASGYDSILLIPFYPLVTIGFLLKFLILTAQRRVRNHAREMVCETDCATVEK